MVSAVLNLWESLRVPHLRKVFFHSLPFNRKVMMWYAGKMVDSSSRIEPLEKLQELDRFRREKKSLTFICNHLSYADSHIIETMMIRNGLKSLADHLIHIAGQKTFELSRRAFTRSLNTVRVYQPKASIDPSVKKKMNSKALKWAAHLKKAGYSLLVFPEGTRSRKEKRFNIRGANPKATIYFRSSYVVPLGLMGSEQIMPVGRTLPQKSRIRLIVGEPVFHPDLEQEYRIKHPESSDTELRSLLMSDYMSRINQLLDPEYQSLTLL